MFVTVKVEIKCKITFGNVPGPGPDWEMKMCNR